MGQALEHKRHRQHEHLGVHRIHQRGLLGFVLLRAAEPFRVGIKNLLIAQREQRHVLKQLNGCFVAKAKQARKHASLERPRPRPGPWQAQRELQICHLLDRRLEHVGDDPVLLAVHGVLEHQPVVVAAERKAGQGVLYEVDVAKALASLLVYFGCARWGGIPATPLAPRIQSLLKQRRPSSEAPLPWQPPRKGPPHCRFDVAPLSSLSCDGRLRIVQTVPGGFAPLAGVGALAAHCVLLRLIRQVATRHEH